MTSKGRIEPFGGRNPKTWGLGTSPWCLPIRDLSEAARRPVILYRQQPSAPAEPFGIVNRAERSVALWNRGDLPAYGGPSALRTLVQAYANWTSYGLPRWPILRCRW